MPPDNQRADNKKASKAPPALKAVKALVAPTSSFKISAA
jgi:hypothetical protein